MIQYKQVVNQDSYLIDVEFLGSEQSVPFALRGLACRGIYTVTGAPNSPASFWCPGAIVQNAVSGVCYRNSGSTASPAWTAM